MKEEKMVTVTITTVLVAKESDLHKVLGRDFKAEDFKNCAPLFTELNKKVGIPEKHPVYPKTKLPSSGTEEEHSCFGEGSLYH